MVFISDSFLRGLLEGVPRLAAPEAFFIGKGAANLVRLTADVLLRELGPAFDRAQHTAKGVHVTIGVRVF
jgi:hypothetical protein